MSVRQRHQATANRIDAISRLVRQDRASGNIEIECEEEFEFVAIDPYRSRNRRRTHVTIELELYDYELEFLEEIIETSDEIEARARDKFGFVPRCKCPDRLACPLHNWQHLDFGNPAVVLPPPAPDYLGAVDRLVRIVKVIEKAEATKWSVVTLVKIIGVIQRAWAMDDSSKRFKMLELD